MLRQIELWVPNGPITETGVLLVTTLCFWKFCFSLRTVKSWFDVPATHMCIFVLFVRAGVIFDDAFSLWVSLTTTI